METTAQFDLERAILEWRKTLAECPAIRGADLDELESHLRDSVASLQGRGLTEREAFMLARARLGGLDSLNEEFGKMNIEHVWLDRVLWIVAGSIALKIGSSLASGMGYLMMAGACKLGGSPSWLGPCSLIIHLLLGAAMLLFLWRSLRTKGGMLWRTGCLLRGKPVLAGLVAIAFSVIASGSQFGGTTLMFWSIPRQHYSSIAIWSQVSGILFMIFWPALLVYLLWRYNSRQGMASVGTNAR